MERIEAIERQIYEAAEIPSEAVKKQYVHIQMTDFTEHDIWTVSVDYAGYVAPDLEGAGSREKPTLVLAHGFGSASCHLVLLTRELMKHYKVILFDNLSFGMNSRQGQSSANRLNCDEIDAWLAEYWQRWVDACPGLPQKFYLAGHSFGAY